MEDINFENIRKEIPKAESKIEHSSLSRLEAKIDQILGYQKTVRHLAIMRGIISFIFFLIFIVLPIVGSFYLFRFMSEKVDFNQISSQYKEFYESLEQLKSTSDTVEGLSDKIDEMKNVAVDSE